MRHTGPASSGGSKTARSSAGKEEEQEEEEAQTRLRARDIISSRVSKWDIIWRCTVRKMSLRGR